MVRQYSFSSFCVAKGPQNISPVYCCPERCLDFFDCGFKDCKDSDDWEDKAKNGFC
jgi:hypothetical protein